MDITHLRKLTEEVFEADEKQRRYEANFRRLYNSISDLIFILDLEFNIIHTNDAVNNALHTTLLDIQGSNFLDFVTSSNRKEVHEILLEQDTTTNFYFSFQLSEGQVLHFDGSLDISEWSGSPALFLIARDITEKIKYENVLELKTIELEAYNQELQATEDELRKKMVELEYNFNLFREMCNNVPEMIWAKNIDKEYIFANLGLCKTLLKCDPDEVVGKTDMFFVEREREKHPDNPEWHTFGELCQDSDQVILDTLKSGYFEESGNVEDKYLVLAVHKSPFYFNDELIGVVGTARDITEFKDIQVTLQNKWNFLDSIMGALPIPIYYRGLDGTFYDCNEAFVHYYGAPKSYIIGKTVDELFPELKNSIQYRDDELIQSGKPQYYDCSLFDRNMKPINTLIARTLHILSDGTIGGIIGAVMCPNHSLYLSEDRL